jgi:LssY C-terminus
LNHFRKISCCALLAALTALALSLRPTSTCAQSSGVVATKSYQVDVDASKQWVDTKIDVHAGAKLHFTATGTISYPDAADIRPQGQSRNFKDLIHQYAVGDAGRGALIARLGSDDVAEPFLVGASKDYIAPVANRLLLGINQSMKDAGRAQGVFHVTVEVISGGSVAADAALVGGPAESVIAAITPDLLAKIPRRVADPDGDPGDMVNIFIVGSENEVTNVFTSAGWVQVDKTAKESVFTGLAATLEKKDYLTMPMSTLFLFGRAQDYGFAHAEAVKVVMSRNHLRVWKSPYAVEGRPLWCVAATHDIGFERDERNNGVTHKIDPAIDDEREYVNSTLSSTGFVARRAHVTPANPLIEARTATGGSFHSDGRILVLVLRSGTALAF